MNQKIEEKLALFSENTQIMRNSFKWQHAGTKRLVALLYTLENKTVDCLALKESFDLIKMEKGMFSMFRGNMHLFIAGMLSLDEGCRQRLADVSRVYDMLKKVKFRASDYLAVAAYLIVADTDEENYENTVHRSKEFYDRMKKNNWFHIGEDDYIFSVMLGLSDIDIMEGSERVSELHNRLKPEFKMAGGNSVQTLAQMLTLGGKTDDALGHLLLLRNTLRSRRIKLDRAYTLPALGALSLLPVEGYILVENILDAQSYLRRQKGLGSFSISTQELLLFSSALISSVYAKEMDEKVIASTSVSILNIIIAQQVAMIVAVSMAASASASASC
jgi:hypothetical protein